MSKTIRNVKRIVCLFAFVILLYLIGKVLDYLTVDDTQSYTRVMMQEMYAQNNIDSLFIGSSHSYRSINPRILDEEWKENTFNAGTASQQTDGSYYLLKEAVQNNQVKTVYMEVYYDVIGTNEDYRSPTASYIISDYMKSPINRVQYLWESGGIDSLQMGLMRCRRDWEKLWDWSYIKELAEKKRGTDYRNYNYIKFDDEYYAGKGYVCKETGIKEGSFCAEQDFAPIAEDAISIKSRNYLDKIIKLCKEKGRTSSALLFLK